MFSAQKVCSYGAKSVFICLSLSLHLSQRKQIVPFLYLRHVLIIYNIRERSHL